MENNDINPTETNEKVNSKPKKPLFGNFDFVYGFILGLIIMFVIGGSTFYVYFFGFPPFINDYIIHHGTGNASMSLASISELEAGDNGHTAENGAAGEADSVSEQTAGSLKMAAVTRKLGILQTLIDQNYLFPEDADKAATYIYKGFLASLTDEDPYAHYYSAEEMNERKSQQNGTYYGIGAGVHQLEDTNEILVINIYPGSPAETAGMQIGDVLYKINGIDVSDMTLSYVVENLIQGDLGTSFECVVKRDGKEVTMRITRADVEIPRVAYGTLSEFGINATHADEIGYISFANFYSAEGKQTKAALDDLINNAHISSLIIDLRGNPGGDIEVAASLLDYILPDDLTNFTDGKSEFQQGKTLFAYTRNKLGKGQEWYAGDGHEINIPIVILQNQNSASASELFSGCLQDYGVATVVGTQSYGKGIVQSITTLQDGSAVEFTTHYYYIPSGLNIHKIGITPDVTVEMGETADEYMVSLNDDVQLQKAVSILDGEVH
ncbi:S41 family peptidase [Oribacterium sp. WCC10]|uniref:S41 family peptidase n=1 Tax=Oribacterium sp. WCC10 TaxID=1855343 RepID=UPI0008E03E3F|nr:S41 family peptidase [Oribacterium sp. WCC10]SFG48376.1 carboxyl-terminal processing protease [Oribacterium sp. WCC10]